MTSFSVVNRAKNSVRKNAFLKMSSSMEDLEASSINFRSAFEEAKVTSMRLREMGMVGSVVFMFLKDAVIESTVRISNSSRYRILILNCG